MSQKENDNLSAFSSIGLGNIRTSFEPGEELEGRVTAVTRDAIFLDINAKSEGIVDKNELEENGQLLVKEGDVVKAFFVKAKKNGELILTVKIGEKAVDDESIEDAYKAEIPIQGRVESERKGGYSIAIGSRVAFCPYSQIDINPASEKALYLGQRFSFIISEYDGSNLVVSRRKLLQSELEKNINHLKETLHEGDIIKGTVKRIMDFGVFVDIGGIDGLIPMGELDWPHVKNAEDVVRVEEVVSVKLLKIQWPENRLTLSLKQVKDNPWNSVKDNYRATKQYDGTVTRLTNFGAFVALEPGVEGLIHISKLGAGKRLSHASEVLQEGQEISVFIEVIDYEKNRISLTLENPQEGRTMTVEGDKLKVGEVLTGSVQDIKPFGIFVRLTSAATGLLHVSEIPFQGAFNSIKAMLKRYPAGSEITVVIKSIQQNRIALILPGSNTEDNIEYQQFLAEKKDGGDFGNLGSAFDQIQLKQSEPGEEE